MSIPSKMGRHFTLFLYGLALPLCVSVCAPWLGALSVRLEKLADAAPQSFGTAFGVPWVVGNTVYFSKTDDQGSGSAYGIYSASGGPLVTWGQQLSGATVGNLSISDVDGPNFIVGGFSAYVPGEPNTYYGAIHQFPGGQHILDRYSPFPGYPVPHPRNPIGNATIDGSRVAMTVVGTNIAPAQPSAIAVRDSGNISLIAKEGDSIPGTNKVFTAFDTFARPYAEGGTVAFVGKGSGISGIYEWTSGSLRKVVDQNTPAPQGGTLGSFFESRSVVKEGADYAFITDSTASHLYKMVGGTVTLVASNQTPVPGGIGNLLNFFAPTLRDGHVVFLGSRDNQFLPPRRSQFGWIGRWGPMSVFFLVLGGDLTPPHRPI